MTTAELIVDLKNYLGPGVDVDNDGLKTWLNDAYMYMVDEIVKANPDFFARASTADAVANQQEYDLPTDFERVLMVNIQIDNTWIRVRPLNNTSVSDIPFSADIAGQVVTWGNPVYYILKDNIGFFPIPTDNGDETIKLWYVYTPLELDTDSDTPEIPKKYHHIIKIGAKANYLSRDGEDQTGILMWKQFEDRVQQMIETMFENNVDGPKAIQYTNDY